MNKFKKGDKVKIAGIIRYWQDMRLWEGGFPDDMIFTVEEEILNNSLYELTAPGYGEKDNYGEGSIFVYKKWFKNLVKVDVYNNGLEVWKPDIISNGGPWATHNMPCPVYYDKGVKAVLDLGSGIFLPSWKAQREGYMLVKVPKYLRWFMKRYVPKG